MFDKVVADYHGVPAGQPIKHPQPNFGDMQNLPFADLDPEGKYVISTRVRVGRSVDGIPFPPLINLEVIGDCFYLQKYILHDNCLTRYYSLIYTLTLMSNVASKGV